MRRFPLPLLAVVLAALVLAPGAVAAATKFKGENDQNRTLTFKVRGKKVVDFVGGVGLFCLGGGGIQANAVIPPKALRIKGGKFKYKGEDKNGTSIELKGRIKGKKASGTMSMVDSYFSGGRSYSCTYDGKWTAKRR